MSNKSWLQRLEAQVVIHVPDERDREVQDLGFRAGYIVASVAALGLSAYREVFTGQSGLILPTAAIVALPLLIPLGRRLLAGGLAPADERVRRLQTRAFRWAYVLLACGLTAYCMFRAIALDDLDALWNFMVPEFVGGLFGFLTQVSQNTLRVTYRGYVALAVIYLSTLVGQASILLIVVRFGQPITGYTSVIVMTILAGMIMVGYMVISLLAARRRRREEREEQAEREGERLTS